MARSGMIGGTTTNYFESQLVHTVKKYLAANAKRPSRLRDGLLRHAFFAYQGWIF